MSLCTNMLSRFQRTVFVVVATALSGCSFDPGVFAVDYPSILNLALSLGVSPDRRTSSGDPLLVVAAKAGSAASVFTLLDHGANPGKQNGRGEDARYYATIGSDRDVFRLLCADNSYAHDWSDENLRLAAEQLVTNNTFAERSAALKSAGLDRAIGGEKGVKLLVAALRNEQLASAQALLEAGVAARDLPYDLLAPQTAPGREQLLSLLFKAGADARVVGTDKKSLTYAALENSSPEAVAVILGTGASLARAYGPHDPLVLALLKSYSGIAVELLRRGVPPENSEVPLSAVDVAEIVLDEVFLDELERRTPSAEFATAAALSTTNRARDAFLALGYDAQAVIAAPGVLRASTVKDFQAKHSGLLTHGYLSLVTRTMLFAQPEVRFLQACSDGDTAEVTRLLEQKPELLRLRNANEWDGLMTAAYGGKTDVVKLLIDRGAKIDGTDKNGSTALLLATIGASNSGSSADGARTASVLLKAGADKKRSNRDKATPSHVASAVGGDLASVLGEQPAGKAVRANLLVAVMGRPRRDDKGQSFQCCDDLACLRKFQATERKEGRFIRDVSYIGGRRCAITGNAPFQGGTTQELAEESDTELSANWKSRGQKKLTHYDIVASGTGRYLALLTQNPTGGTDGGLSAYSSGEFTREVKEKVGKKYFLSRIYSGSSSSSDSIRWRATYGDSHGYRDQRYTVGGSADVLSFMGEHIKKGFHVTSLELNDEKSSVVLSKGSNLKDQAILLAQDWTELRKKIKEKWDKDWQLILFAGSAAR